MKPRIVITIGDPAGIGPEIVAAAMRDRSVLAACEPIVVGDPVAFKIHRLPLPKVEVVSSPGLRDNLRLGKPSVGAGRSAVECLQVAVGLVRGRQGQALVTAPVSKESLHLAGAGVPGHTEWLARECNAAPVAMLMVAGSLRALLLTRHVPISAVSRTLTQRTIEDAGRLADQFVTTVLKIRKPRLVACGLNPHAGDGGLIGKEEEKILGPALRALKQRGILIKGPRPADTVFREMADDEWDLALAAYHDQGMIPLKLYAPGRLVNVTLGLPFIRTSPGHGTAYDISGKGKANAAAMIEAIKLAAQFSKGR